MIEFDDLQHLLQDCLRTIWRPTGSSLSLWGHGRAKQRSEIYTPSILTLWFQNLSYFLFLWKLIFFHSFEAFHYWALGLLSQSVNRWRKQSLTYTFIIGTVGTVDCHMSRQNHWVAVVVAVVVVVVVAQPIKKVSKIKVILNFELRNKNILNEI